MVNPYTEAHDLEDRCETLEAEIEELNHKIEQLEAEAIRYEERITNMAKDLEDIKELAHRSVRQNG